MEKCEKVPESSEMNDRTSHDESSEGETLKSDCPCAIENKETTSKDQAVGPAAQSQVPPLDDFVRLGLSPAVLTCSVNASAGCLADDRQQPSSSLPASDDNAPRLVQSDANLSSSSAQDADAQSCPPVISPSLPVLMHMDITHVCDGLYLSDFISLSASRLRELGVTFVINATQEIPFVEGADGTVEFMKLYIDDVPTADIAQHFHTCTDKLRDNRTKGGNSLIHCALGISRSVTICLAYLVKYEGRTLRQAYMELKKKRPIIRPNDGFWRQLIAFETAVRGRATVKLNVYPMGVIPDVYRSAPKTGASRRYSVSYQ
jgi:atypical dual specificity phosphatase